MSGVIIDNIQYEHCNGCDAFPRLTQLGYQKPSKANPYGKMLCIKCVNKLPQWHLARIVPAPEWQAVRG